MGIIQRQSIQSSILFYIGAAIGFANKILLFTRFLSTEEVGLANILANNALLYAQFSALGFSMVALRFFPYFNDRSRQQHTFLFWMLVIPAFGFLFVTLLIVLFQHQIFAYFQEESPLMVEYFWYLVPLSFATLYFDLFDAYLRSLMKTVVPVLLREVIQRLFISISILLHVVGWITFPQFVAVYVAMLSSITLLILFYTFWLGHLRILVRPTWRMRMLMRKILVFGGFALLGNLSSFLIFTIDGLMLASYEGMDSVGIYTTCIYIVVLITIPWRAIQKVAVPQVAEHWKNWDMEAMQRLYQRTSLINFALGLFLFLSMVALKDVMFALLPGDYRAGLTVMVVIGASRVLDMLTGLNSYLLVTSKYFRVDLVMTLLLLVLAIYLNDVLIPKYGIDGAAWATAIALTISNLFKITFLWIKFRLHPFSSKMLILALVAFVGFIGCLLLATWVPRYPGIALGYGFFLMVFLGASWKWNLVPDMVTFVAGFLGKK